MTMLAGVELGGTKCIAVLADAHGTMLEQYRVPTTSPGETFAKLRQQLGNWTYAALGIASFGPLDLDPASPAFGSIVTTTKPGWSDIDLKQLVTTDAPYCIDTDVNAAALAEGLWGDAQMLTNWAYITVGTGVGVGTIIDRRPLSGIGHSEAGHMRVPFHAAATEGNCRYHRNCVEGLICGPALQARTGIPAEQIPPDHPVWIEVASILSALCHNLVLTTLPERIFIGGGVGLRPGMAESVNAMLRESLAGYAHSVRVFGATDAVVQRPRSNESAGPQGAIALARSALMEGPVSGE